MTKSQNIAASYIELWAEHRDEGLNYKFVVFLFLFIYLLLGGGY